MARTPSTLVSGPEKRQVEKVEGDESEPRGQERKLQAREAVPPPAAPPRERRGGSGGWLTSLYS